MELPLTPIEFARRARKLYAGREAVVDGDRRFTYGQFLERCDRFSAALQSWGIRQGDRVAYIAPNTAEHLEGYYAVPQIGAVIVPLNYRLSGEDLEYVLNHSGARVVCVHREFLETIDRLKARLPMVERYVALEGARDGWEEYEQVIASCSPAFRQVDIAEGDLISINYTSGTTARPKGVMITHRNAYLNAVGAMIHLQLSPKDRYLWTLPMFHANGWTFVWIITARGGTHVCLRKVDPAAVMETTARERVSILCAAPTVLIGLAHTAGSAPVDLQRGVRVLVAGAPPAAVTIERIEGHLGWQITQVYGLTETSPFISICEDLPEHDRLDASARYALKACQGVELVTSGDLRVVDPEGREVPRDGATVGEVVVRGNVVMKGYYNDVAETHAAMPDGWFHSGDAGVLHVDGYLEIRDRIKDVIISGGENISSVEVEGVLLRHPAIEEVAVVGMPHEKWGEAPHAFVVIRPGARAEVADIMQFAREHLAHFKAPRWITVLECLPKTATGKVQKHRLRGGRAGISTQ